MKGNKFKVYIASGWFNDRDREILSNLEEMLGKYSELAIIYSPRRDGVKLEPDQFHSQELRKRVFDDNVANIDSSDLVIANLDTGSKGLDTGTVWEVGHAMAAGVPVVAIDQDGHLSEIMNSICEGLDGYFSDIAKLEEYFLGSLAVSDAKESVRQTNAPRILFIGPDDTPELVEGNQKISDLLLDNFGKRFRWMADLKHENMFARIDDMFSGVDVVLAVIDERNPIVSWVMGQAYTRGIPIISYTNFDYGVNLMLALSIVRHVKGLEDLKTVIDILKREGIDGLGGFNTESLRVY